MSLDKYLSDRVKSNAVNIRLSEQEFKQVKNLARQHNVSITQLVRAMIKQELAKNESSTAL